MILRNRSKAINGAAMATLMISLPGPAVVLAKPKPRLVTKDSQHGTIFTDPRADGVAYLDGAGRVRVRLDTGKLEGAYDVPSGCALSGLSKDAVGLSCGNGAIGLLMRGSGELRRVEPQISGWSGYTISTVGTRWVQAVAYGELITGSHRDTLAILVNRSTGEVLDLSRDEGGVHHAIDLNRQDPFRPTCHRVRRHGPGEDRARYLPSIFIGSKLFEQYTDSVRGTSTLTGCSGGRPKTIPGSQNGFSVFNGGFYVEGSVPSRYSTILHRLSDGRAWRYKDAALGGVSGGSSALLSKHSLWIQNDTALYRLSLPRPRGK